MATLICHFFRCVSLNLWYYAKIQIFTQGQFREMIDVSSKLRRSSGSIGVVAAPVLIHLSPSSTTKVILKILKKNLVYFSQEIAVFLPGSPPQGGKTANSGLFFSKKRCSEEKFF